jgi:hypothetical protein
MSAITGMITREGDGVEGLRVVASTEVRIGYAVEPKPCVTGAPRLRQVGSTTTDSSGQFRIAFAAEERPELACRFIQLVSVSVFDGLVLLWRSPKVGVRPLVRLDHELAPSDETGEASGSGVVHGRITECGEGTRTYRVDAFEETTIRIDGRKGTIKTTTLLGSEFPASDGRYTFSFSPPIHIESLESAHVYIRLFAGSTLVWESSKVLIHASAAVTIDHELYPDCPSGSARVRVVDEAGHLVPSADVFVNGEIRARTDAAGQAFVKVERGDTLVARKLLHEQQTSRDHHGRGSSQNWNYRVYITSLTITHDDKGDNVTPVPYVVEDPLNTHDLQLRRRNTLIGLNLRASLEWDASNEMKAYEDALVETSELLYNSTDGQFLIEQVDLSDDGLYWDEADIHVYARFNRSGKGSYGGLWSDNGYVRVNPYDGQWPEVLEHELGHYAFNLRDEYAAGDGWDEDNGKPRCTLKSGTSDPLFGKGMPKQACVMTGSQGEIKKLCSSHPDNPHAKGTEQGDTDCWAAVTEHYSDPLRRWRLLTPTDRDAIPNRFPDSGIPLGRTTPRLSGAVNLGSYIPLADWKANVFQTRRARAGLCEPFLRCRCEFEGVPTDEVTVWVRTSYGRTYEAGYTQANDYADGTSTAIGETLVRGAHVGDRLVALLDAEPPLYFRSHVITESDCASGFSLLRGYAEDQPDEAFRTVISPDEIGAVDILVTTSEPLAASVSGIQRRSAVAEPEALRFERANENRYRARVSDLPREYSRTFTVTTLALDQPSLTRSIQVTGMLVDEETLTSLDSTDGQLHVVLRPHSIKASAQLVCWNVPLPKAADDLQIVAGPYELALTGNASLIRPALLYFTRDTLAADEGKGNDLAVVRRGRDSDRWKYLATARAGNDISAEAPEFGTFALVRPRAAPA